MTRSEAKIALEEMGYEVIAIGTRWAVVRSRDLHGQPYVMRRDWRAMAEEGLFD